MSLAKRVSRWEEVGGVAVVAKSEVLVALPTWLVGEAPGGRTSPQLTAAPPSSSGIFVGPLVFRFSSRFKTIEPSEQVFDVGGKILPGNVFCCPSQRRADAGEEVNVVKAGGVF